MPDHIYNGRLTKIFSDGFDVILRLENVTKRSNKFNYKMPLLSVDILLSEIDILHVFSDENATGSYDLNNGLKFLWVYFGENLYFLINLISSGFAEQKKLYLRTEGNFTSNYFLNHGFFTLLVLVKTKYNFEYPLLEYKMPEYK